MSFGLMNKIRPEFNSGEKKKEKPLGESVTPSGIDGIKSLRINILYFTLPYLLSLQCINLLSAEVRYYL